MLHDSEETATAFTVAITRKEALVRKFTNLNKNPTEHNVENYTSVLKKKGNPDRMQCEKLLGLAGETPKSVETRHPARA